MAHKGLPGGPLIKTPTLPLQVNIPPQVSKLRSKAQFQPKKKEWHLDSTDLPIVQH